MNSRLSLRDSLNPISQVSEGSEDEAIDPPGYRRLDFSGVDAPRLTHYLFRFPAKFHPPVAHALLRAFTVPGDTVLDPFCGSGTLLLAAAAEGRHSIGVDVDPLAVLLTKVKTHRLRPGHLRASWLKLIPTLDKLSRSADEYSHRQFVDLTTTEYEQAVSTHNLAVPNIPNLFHWFRRYVIVDLAQILHVVEEADIPETHRQLFRLVFASIVRNASNADPVPVSGLEVTSYMKKKDAAGRTIDPFTMFRKAVGRALAAAAMYCNAVQPGNRISVIRGDATRLSALVKKPVDAAITSPPYHNAVDYYRRHKLEMFWLGLTPTQADRLALLPRYIGRSRIPLRDPLLREAGALGILATAWYQDIRQISRGRADAFLHYSVSMQRALKELGSSVRPGGCATFVLGHSRWNGSEIPTSELFEEMAQPAFELAEKLWYPVKNRYMSYDRRNGASIDREYVLVFRRTSHDL
jgi:SAM-dependent methyltransferase